MVNLNDRLNELRQKDAEQSARWHAENERVIQQIQAERELFGRNIRPNLRVARPEDYARWLRGFMEAGGSPSHTFDYRMPSDFYVAVSSFDLPAYYGAGSIHVIVPQNVKVTFGDIGHNSLYLMENFDHVGSWIPVYSDIVL
jgi:hypothetical protein